MTTIVKDVRINREIRAREVRVIDPDGKQLGVLPLYEALRTASSLELDLVEVSPKAEPPVCRIMDYGKFKYQQRKKDQEAKKRQAIIHMKEVKMRPKTEAHDFQFKVRNIERFLKEGNKIKVTMVFRGREMAHTDIGKNLLIRVVDAIKEWGKVEQDPRFEGRNCVMLLTPTQVPKPGERPVEKPKEGGPGTPAPA